MLADIVVDTNVFVHAHNPNHAFSNDSRELASALLAPGNATALRVDPGFDPVEANNRSRIVGEYLEKLVPGMIGYHLVQALAADGRVRPVDASKDKNVKAAVRKLVKDPSDRVFLLTTLMSVAKVLVTHDDHAFPDSVRSDCGQTWAVNVCEAPDSVLLLAA
jgi:hypothetical protein